ncbi:hypothetical protein BC938DRAFT_472280 [Jimgerdemannia flammicorona]|uniref:Uncharacterized protein n=1 Tax=Jimgerdemannia flammicorona TaxID=994334 RepID=A0A433QU02_9FUNG|nr:hypothetical protein BC938DRAFT_472280 [Jimgerdemannia flammicorona]
MLYFFALLNKKLVKAVKNRVSIENTKKRPMAANKLSPNEERQAVHGREQGRRGKATASYFGKTPITEWSYVSFLKSMKPIILH